MPSPVNIINKRRKHQVFKFVWIRTVQKFGKYNVTEIKRVYNKLCIININNNSGNKTKQTGIKERNVNIKITC